MIATIVKKGWDDIICALLPNCVVLPSKNTVRNDLWKPSKMKWG